jgi:hypothetical protein
MSTNEFQYLPADPSTWETGHVIQWLHLIQASRYCDRFKQENITGKVLVKFEERDLSQFGILDPIDRRRIFLEIQLANKVVNSVEDGAESAPEDTRQESSKDHRESDLIRMRSRLSQRSSSRSVSKKMSRPGPPILPQASTGLSKGKLYFLVRKKKT